MTVGKDTIQTLLRQRQNLRQALQELQKDIASLNDTASDLVANNIKKPAKPASIANSADSEKTVNNSSGRSETKLPGSMENVGRGSETASNIREIEKEKAQGSDGQKLTAPTLATFTGTKAMAPEPHLSASTVQQNDVSKLAYMSLLHEAKQLSSYYLRHPSPGEDLPLQQLDDAISAADGKMAKGGGSREYQALRKAYRSVAGRSFSASGITGRTLEDSRLSAHILWFLPITICALVLVIFPFLLLGRTVSLEMFTSDFAADLIWVFGVAAAYLWGAAGALTSLSIHIALLVKNRRYEADIRRSPGIRAALGGILGSGIYALLNIWLPQSNITTEFFLNLGAFAVGLLAWIVFLAIQNGLRKLIRLFNPDIAPSSAKGGSEK